MRLKSLKLAGFKSFVEPTTITFPSDLVAILGPNGCGKSNVIDAVKFVLGAHSRDLRGDSKEDVIFNGSEQRKPMGRASVELVFDNSDQKLGGEYASYNEIEVRREITRDGDSTYYLNGVRCRKRDISDIFLGTGLGPRSYAIIEQGTISRIIEAKPDEMRMYVEEAAGISKYKERRRETSNRMQHTRDNLARLDDLRQEIERQLAHLEKQAETAKEYQQLKEKEHTLRAELITVRYSQYQAELLSNKDKQETLKTKHLEFETKWQHLDSQEATTQQSLHQLQDELSGFEQQFYSVGNDIVRCEQQSKYLQERQQQWQEEISTCEQALLNLQDQELQEQQKLQELTEQLLQLEPEHANKQEQFTTATQDLTARETCLQQVQDKLTHFQQQQAQFTQQAEVAKTSIEHLEQELQQNLARQTKLQEELARHTTVTLEEEIAALHTQQEVLLEKLTSVQQVIDDIAHKRQHNIAQATHCQQQLQRAQEERHQRKEQQTSLTALQKIALHKQDDKLNAWLQDHQLNELPRLAQQLRVQPGYERAVETVLGHYLEAICVDSLTDFQELFNQLPPARIALYAARQESIHSNRLHLDALVDKVECNKSLATLLAKVYVVNDLIEAWPLLSQLAMDESLITRDGVWLNQQWLKINAEDDEHSGVLTREQQLQEINQNLSEIEAEIAHHSDLLAEYEQARLVLEQEQQLQQQELQRYQREVAQQAAQIQLKEGQVKQIQHRHDQISSELQDINSLLQQTQQNLQSTKIVWNDALQQIQTVGKGKHDLEQEREVALQAWQQSKFTLADIQAQCHQYDLQLQAVHKELQYSKQHLQHVHTNRQEKTDKIAELSQRQSDLLPELAELAAQLTEYLSKHGALEQEITRLRQNIQEINHNLSEMLKQKQNTEREMSTISNQLQQKQLEAQSLQVKMETLAEQALELAIVLEEELSKLNPESKDNHIEKQLQQVRDAIAVLGLVNLAAIDEFAVQQERKVYYDLQHDDLMAALTALEEAIAKIDEETRERFKATFDQINAGLGAFFPKIFGGGQAELTLTEGDLLSAGVQVTAKPPGKKNSTIHLLSGGEKALTAVALVFAIFQLNPAPFCLLDEVDAPLDDANVGRFCNLVKEMVQQVQFIYISHNKISMEMAEQLIGVTMQEPGVSRIVAVDIDQAVMMAAS